MTTQTAQRGHHSPSQPAMGSKAAGRPASPATPLTEDEIRAALTESVGTGWVNLDDAIDMLRVVVDSDVARVRMPWQPDFYPRDDHPGTLWADLRPEEAEELSAAMSTVLHQVERAATAMLIERATAAAMAFAAAHPDVPRGHWPLVVPAEGAA